MFITCSTFQYRPVGDSSPTLAYPEDAGEGEEAAAVAAPGFGHFFEDFFSFIHGNSWARVPPLAAGTGPSCGCGVRSWRPLEVRFWLLGRAWLLVQGLKLGMVCSKGGGITVESLIDEVWNDSRTAGKDVRHSAREGWLFMNPISLSNSKFIASLGHKADGDTKQQKETKTRDYLRPAIAYLRALIIVYIGDITSVWGPWSTKLKTMGEIAANSWSHDHT